jgi:hypothetical protein
MQNQSLHSPERFQDPLGEHMQAARAAHARHMNRFIAVADAYQGFYARLKPQGARGMSYLSGAEGIIGTTLRLRLFEGGPGFVASDGGQVAAVEGREAEKLTVLSEQGWIMRCVLANTTYSAQEKSFGGEFACIAYSPQLDEGAQKALEVFAGNITDRIAHASRPGLALTQEQFVRVIESGGAWFLTKDEPWPQLPQGTVFYRRRRTLNDRLVGAAIEGNRGCLIASWVGLVLVVAAILWAAWYFFLSTPS